MTRPARRWRRRCPPSTSMPFLASSLTARSTRPPCNRPSARFSDGRRDRSPVVLSNDGQGAFALELGQVVLHLAGYLPIDPVEIGIRSEALSEVDRRMDLDGDLRWEGDP